VTEWKSSLKLGVFELQPKGATRGRSTARLPLVVRTAADVQALRANSRTVRRLPVGGLKIAIDGLNADAAKTLKARIGAYVSACGCAEGGASALIALFGVLVFFAVRIPARGARWSDLGMVATGLLLVVLGGGLGKLFGLTIARLRFERCCDEVIRMIEER
jgi:hypothetical protein